jgi:glycosyltransferase involved in cell wall biosynthesis
MKHDRKFIFGFIGTFGYWHGIDVLEKIIPTLTAADERIHFLLMGDGMLRKQLEDSLHAQIVAERVFFTGVIPQENAPKYLAQCDTFLCPTQPNSDGTRFFGSPTKLFEYMSMAKPIIASDLEQLTEIISPAIRIENGVTTRKEVTDEVGILVDPLNIQGFIDACLFCISLSEENKKLLGDNAREKVLEQYTWQSHVQKIIDHAQL